MLQDLFVNVTILYHLKYVYCGTKCFLHLMFVVEMEIGQKMTLIPHISNQ